MKKRIAIIGGLVVAVGVIGVVAWYVSHRSGSTTEDSKVYVTTVATLMGDVSGTQNRYAGIVEPQKTVNVKVESGRKVKNTNVKVGDSVKTGDVLFEYDASSTDDQLAQAELDLERYVNEANSLNSTIETLNKEKKAASADEQLSYTIEIKTAEMDLKKNEINQKSKKREIEKLKNSSKDLTVKSEIEGVVKKINESAVSSDDSENDSSMDSGGGDNSGGNSNYITIVATGTYRVKGTINETNMNSIVEGEPVIIRSRVDTETTWNGTMGAVDTKEPEKESTTDNGFSSGESTDTQTSSSNYPFYVKLESTDGLMIGQHVYIEPDAGQLNSKDGIWLDEFYLVDVDSNPYVWASTSKDQLEKRSITLGDYDDALGKYQIKKGLSKEDCIAFPDDSYKEGMEVSIVETAQELTNSIAGEEMEDSLDSSMDSSLDSDFDSSMDSGTLGDSESELDSGTQILEEGVSP